MSNTEMKHDRTIIAIAAPEVPPSSESVTSVPVAFCGTPACMQRMHIGYS